MVYLQEIVTVCLQPATAEAAAHYQELYHYLNGRQRCGVVGHINKVIKDMYLFPLPKKASLPKALLPFKGPGKKFGNHYGCTCDIRGFFY